MSGNKYICSQAIIKFLKCLGSRHIGNENGNSRKVLNTLELLFNISYAVLAIAALENVVLINLLVNISISFRAIIHNVKATKRLAENFKETNATTTDPIASITASNKYCIFIILYTIIGLMLLVDGILGVQMDMIIKSSTFFVVFLGFLENLINILEDSYDAVIL